MSRVVLVPYDQVSFAERLSSAIAHIVNTHVPSTGIYDQDELVALLRMPHARVNSTRRPDAHVAVEAGAADGATDGATNGATDRASHGATDGATDGATGNNSLGG